MKKICLLVALLAFVGCNSTPVVPTVTQMQDRAIKAEKDLAVANEAKDRLADKIKDLKEEASSLKSQIASADAPKAPAPQHDSSANAVATIANAVAGQSACIEASSSATVGDASILHEFAKVDGNVTARNKEGTILLSKTEEPQKFDVTVKGNVTMGGTTKMEGTVKMTGNVDVNGKVVVEGRVIVGGKVVLDGKVTADGKVTGTITVDNKTIRVYWDGCKWVEIH